MKYLANYKLPARKLFAKCYCAFVQDFFFFVKTMGKLLSNEKWLILLMTSIFSDAESDVKLWMQASSCTELTNSWKYIIFCELCNFQKILCKIENLLHPNSKIWNEGQMLNLYVCLPTDDIALPIILGKIVESNN